MKEPGPVLLEQLSCDIGAKYFAISVILQRKVELGIGWRCARLFDRKVRRPEVFAGR